MSYTLTLDMPKEDIEFVEAQDRSGEADLAKLFVSFLRLRAANAMRHRAISNQRDALLSVAGGWTDSRSEEEIIADIESHRTAGREVAL